MSQSNSATLIVDKHVEYIKALDSKKDELGYWLTEHLRLNGLYWGLTALCLLNRPNELNRQDVVSFVKSCQNEDGGFGAHPQHDSHMLYTVSAIQILAIQDALNEIDVNAVTNFIKKLQKRDGSFAGDEWGEIDTRFIYGAFNCLSLLGQLEVINVDEAVNYIVQCKNFDGGFGLMPGAETHSGQSKALPFILQLILIVFTCVGALSIANRLDVVDAELLGSWLSERQLKSGGLNGRPEKLEDVCYSWWVVSSLTMINKTHYIDREKLINFILCAQDPEAGGIADRPGHATDVFHTCFGIAGLSLLSYENLEPVDPAYCMPKSTLQRLGIK